MNRIDDDSMAKTQRIFCIGRNYTEHARELNNEVPADPVIFMKPATCLVPVGEHIHYPVHGRELHYEAEVVVLIGKNGKAETETEAISFVAGISLGLDLTLRDLQKKLKQKGLPWEISKSFDGSSPLGKFIAFEKTINFNSIEFTCHVNEQLRQRGKTGDMIFPIPTLIVAISRIWELKAGDLIYTGTPAGVGPLKVGDQVSVASGLIGKFTWQVVQ